MVDDFFFFFFFCDALFTIKLKVKKIFKAWSKASSLSTHLLICEIYNRCLSLSHFGGSQLVKGVILQSLRSVFYVEINHNLVPMIFSRFRPLKRRFVNICHESKQKYASARESIKELNLSKLYSLLKKKHLPKQNLAYIPVDLVLYRKFNLFIHLFQFNS